MKQCLLWPNTVRLRFRSLFGSSRNRSIATRVVRIRQPKEPHEYSCRKFCHGDWRIRPRTERNRTWSEAGITANRGNSDTSLEGWHAAGGQQEIIGRCTIHAAIRIAGSSAKAPHGSGRHHAGRGRRHRRCCTLPQCTSPRVNKNCNPKLEMIVQEVIASRSQMLSEISNHDRTLGQVSGSCSFGRVRELQTAIAAMAAPLQLQDGDRTTRSPDIVPFTRAREGN